MKTSEIKLPPIVGVSGVARSGKDTYVAVANIIMKKATESGVMRSAFADAVKQDLHKLLVTKVGISAYTQDTEEKKIIRPLLVAYGMMMRGIDEDYWVKRLEMNFKLGQKLNLPLFIPDVRFKNEVHFVHKNGGKIIHLSQKNLGPANETEAEHDPIVKDLADIQLQWNSILRPENSTQVEFERLLEKQLSPDVRATLKKLHVGK